MYDIILLEVIGAIRGETLFGFLYDNSHRLTQRQSKRIMIELAYALENKSTKEELIEELLSWEEDFSDWD